MGRRYLAILTAAFLLLVFRADVFAVRDTDEDTDTRMVDARVVEATEYRISVIARTGVEHVIAINDSSTRVLLNGKAVSLKNLRKGDVITVELDEANPLKFAKQIRIDVRPDSELAGAVP